MNYGRFIHGQGWVQEEANGDATDAGGGATKIDEVDGEKTDQIVDDGQKKVDDPAKPVPVTVESLDQAIKTGLAEKAQGPKTEERLAEEKAATDLKAKIEAAGKHANGTPKLNDKGEAQDENAQPVKSTAGAPALKLSKDLALKPEELAALGPKTAARFKDLIGTLKQHEERYATLDSQHKTVTAGRDNIMALLRDTRTSQDALALYLDFNEQVTSGDPKKLEQALATAQAQVAYISKALGKPVAGVDLLDDFPDLKKEVEEEKISAERANEIATQRRREAARQRGEETQEQRERQQQQALKAREDSLAAIDSWSAKLKGSDIDFAAKEAILLPKIAGVIKNYPPQQWVTALQDLWEMITIPKAVAAPGKDTVPLRPSSAKPGPAEPKDMKEAIDRGLKYSSG